MTRLRDEFLSDEDLDLRNLSDEELIAYWNQWLEQAQRTNDADAASYSHGVFTQDPSGIHCEVGTVQDVKQPARKRSGAFPRTSSAMRGLEQRRPG